MSRASRAKVLKNILINCYIISIITIVSVIIRHTFQIRYVHHTVNELVSNRDFKLIL